MDTNSDPRDETTPRPQVSFSIRPGSEPLSRTFLREFADLKLPYHDIMTFDETKAGTPGVVRFDFGAPAALVDQAASWLRAHPNVIEVRQFYGENGAT